MSNIKIAIDAGHGSKTAGKRTPPFKKSVDVNHDKKVDVKKGERYLEHYANTGVANQLYKKLKNYGYNVIRVGWDDANSMDDSDESLSSRQKQIKKEKCDYSISIHFNAYGDGDSFNKEEGVAVYIHNQYPSDSRRLADYVLRELKKGTSQKSRGIYAASLALCNCKTMSTKASILCELAFMTNEREAQSLMANSDFWEESAEEIARAINNYCNSNNSEEQGAKDGTLNLYHTVVPGDTLSELADEYNTTVLELVRLNKLKAPDLILPGQKLLILKYQNYVVKKGDTLSKISKKYLGDAERYPEILKFNQLQSNTISTGQVLMIPKQ